MVDQNPAVQCRRNQRTDGRGSVRGLYRGEGQGSLGLMRYLPKSPVERQEMLAAIGAKSINELFSSIPERYRLRQPLKLPGPLSEAEVIQYFRERAAENSLGYTSLLCGGGYNHLVSVVTQSENFLGVIERVAALADIARGPGAMLVIAVAESVSLGAVRPPAEADIVAMEAQSFGLAPSYGGPFAGVIASRDKYVRQMPGRLAGQTTDTEGRRGFVLTLATREQHI